MNSQQRFTVVTGVAMNVGMSASHTASSMKPLHASVSLWQWASAGMPPLTA
jgi:hypothetical protein